MQMPDKGKHTVMFVFSFIFGVLWGLLSIGAFKTMNQRIAAGDVEGANQSAKKVRTMFTVGLVFTIVVVVLYIILGVVLGISAANM